MSIWSRIHKESTRVGVYMKLTESRHHITDEKYREEIKKIVDGMPVSSRYYKLLQATCRRLLKDNIMTGDDLERKLLTHIIRITRQYGRKWMNPIRCFSRGGIMNALDAKIDDSISKVCNNPKQVPFSVLMDILSCVVLHNVMSQWKEDKFVRNTKVSVVLYYIYLIGCSLLITSIFWLFILTAALTNNDTALVSGALGTSLIFMTHSFISSKK